MGVMVFFISWHYSFFTVFQIKNKRRMRNFQIFLPRDDGDCLTREFPKFFQVKNFTNFFKSRI